MKPSVVSRALKTLVIVEKQPVFIWGSPGIGKSSVLYQLAAELGIALRDIRALLLDPVDLRGLPFIGKDGRSQWATPDFLPQDGEGILFLDELNAAPAMVQASCYQLVLDRRLGEYTLPEGWAIVAAGNRDSDRAATTRMPTPLRNRFVHIDFEVDVQEWSEWAIKTGVRPEVIAFIRFRPEPSALARNYQGLLAKSDPRRDDRNGCFALRQTPGRRFHRFPTANRLRGMRDLHAFGVDDDADIHLHCAKSCSYCGSLLLSTNGSFLASADVPRAAKCF